MRVDITLFSPVANGSSPGRHSFPIWQRAVMIQHVADAAAALEMVHTATPSTTISVNDHSMLRRGKVSVHARWGRTFALLAGDYIVTKCIR